MDSSRSQDHSCADSDGSTLEFSPSVGNNNPPQLLLPPRKRYRSFTPKDDHHNDDIEVSSMPRRKHHQSDTSKEEDDYDDTASQTISVWRKLHEISVLKDIIEYLLENGTFPFHTRSAMRNFYTLWIDKHGVYVDEQKFSKTMVELPERFFKNQKKKLSGENVEVLMGRFDVQIYRLSYLIWGKQVMMNNNGRKNPRRHHY